MKSSFNNFVHRIFMKLTHEKDNEDREDAFIKKRNEFGL